MPTVLTIGDCIVDAVEVTPGAIRHFPGGAALNLAVGIKRLGLTSQLATRFGMDRHGFMLERHLREEGVQVFNTPNVDFTGVAASSRVEGEPTYHFNPAMFRRRIAFIDSLSRAIATADAVVTNSFPFDDLRQAEALAAILGQASGLVVVDPNPRSNLIADIAAYRAGAERVMPAVSLAKLSDEDVRLFYDEAPEKVAGRLFAIGVETVLFTHGRDGASVFTRAGLRVSVPIAGGEGPVVDTMGAGDATLAAVTAFILRHGMPVTEAGWQACLGDAMRVAAATCAHHGGGLVLPTGWIAGEA